MVAGFLNLSSGLSGPPLLGYAISARMPQATFVASIQIVFIVLDLLTVLWRGLPTIPVNDSVWLLVGSVTGIGLAAIAARWVKPRLAGIAMLCIAWVGTMAVIAKGVLALV